MLRPQYTRRPFEIMLLGPPNSGKRTIAAQLVKISDVYYSTNVSDKVPKRNVDRVDFLLIVVDMTQLSSLTLLDEILKKIGVNYLSRKVAIVVTKVDNPDLWEFEKEDLIQLVQPYYDLHIFYVNLVSEIEKKRIIQQISRLIKINTLQYRNVNTSIFKSVELYNLDSETIEKDQNEMEYELIQANNENIP